MARTKKVPLVKKKKSGRSKDVLNDSRKKRKKYVALREIKKFQKETENIKMIPRAPFSRLVRQLIEERCRRMEQPFRVTKGVLECLHESSELYLTIYFEDLNFLSRHAGRVTVMVKDITALRFMKRANQNGLLSV